MHLPTFARRALTLLVIVFAILFVVELIEGNGVDGAFRYAAIWSVASASIFAAIQAFRAKRGVSCMMCEDESVDEEESIVSHA